MIAMTDVVGVYGIEGTLVGMGWWNETGDPGCID